MHGLQCFVRTAAVKGFSDSPISRQLGDLGERAGGV